MQPACLCAAAASLAWAGLACGAQPATAPPAPPQAAASAGPAPATNATGTRVIEDDRVRIEETRRRGDPQRITVHTKKGGGSYEIVVPQAGKDPSQDRGAAGKSTWSVLGF